MRRYSVASLAGGGLRKGVIVTENEYTRRRRSCAKINERNMRLRAYRGLRERYRRSNGESESPICRIDFGEETLKAACCRGDEGGFEGRVGDLPFIPCASSRGMLNGGLSVMRRWSI